eukprot:Gb_35612 [translate_table: standard]
MLFDESVSCSLHVSCELKPGVGSPVLSAPSLDKTIAIGGADMNLSRAFIKDLKRVIIKVGTTVVTRADGWTGGLEEISASQGGQVQVGTPVVGSTATGNVIPMMTSIAQVSTPTSPMTSLHIIGSPSHRVAEPAASVNQSPVNRVVLTGLEHDLKPVLMLTPCRTCLIGSPNSKIRDTDSNVEKDNSSSEESYHISHEEMLKGKQDGALSHSDLECPVGRLIFDDVKDSGSKHSTLPAFQAAPQRLMTNSVYATLLGAVINVSSSEDCLNLYDSGHCSEYIQLFHPENRNTLTIMPEWLEWLLEVLISNFEMGSNRLSNGISIGEIEDLVDNFLIIMLEHSMHQKDGWKDIEATIHCAEWLVMIGGSSTRKQCIRREESLHVFKRRLLGEVTKLRQKILYELHDNSYASHVRMDKTLDAAKRSVYWRHEDRHWSLTQKYAPKTFKELVGQNLVAWALSNAIARGKIGLAYVFYGPHGTGKTSCARIFCSSTELSFPGAE